MNAQNKLIIVLLCAALFAFLGWVVPMLFYSHAPQAYYMQEHSFEAGNVSVGDNSHVLCFERTIHQQSSGTVFVELYLVDQNGSRVEVLSRSDERHFQDGRATIRDTIQLPESFEQGEYRYERIYRMQVYKGQVERTFSFQSEPFYITENATEGHTC